MPTQAELQEENKALKDMLQRIGEGAKIVGAIISISDTKCVVNTGDCKTFEVEKPEFPVQHGDVVNLNPQTLQVMEKQSIRLPGPVCLVKDILGDFMELEGNEEHHKSVTICPTIDRTKLEKGCRVMLDFTGRTAIENLGKPAKKFQRGETAVSWDEIGGLDDIKQEIMEAVEHPFLYPELYKGYGKRPPHGMLLEGEPGNGKTMLGKAVATTLAHRFGGLDNGYLSTQAFMYVKGPEILDKYVGESERKIREIFDGARAHYREKNFPAVIFVDEADAILAKRDSNVSNDILKTIVPQFLVEWDGLDDSPAIVILATNRHDILDPAVVRDGRIDSKFYVGRPDQEACHKILSIYLSKVPLASKIRAGDLARGTVEFLFSDDRCVGQFGTKGKTMMLLLRHLISGAMCKNIVDTALSNAIRRDIAAGRTKTPTGVNERDVFQAVKKVQTQTERSDHSAVMNKLKEEHKHAETEKAKGQEAKLDVAVA